MTTRGIRRGALVGILVTLACWLPATAPAAAAPRALAALPLTGVTPAARPASIPRPPAASDSASLSGNGSPLTSTTFPGADPQASGTGAGDPLAQNGFGSVLCRDPRVAQRLSTAARSNCTTSNFVAAAAPTGNYGFDVHIDSGLLPGSSMIVQDLLLTPVWTALVWVAHALLVALEWCYSLDLLDGRTMSSVTAALHSAQATVTQPWLAAVLAVASVLALYHGLIRRRVAETLGEALLVVAMMATGLWVILDPVGTVGNVGHWANNASLGTVGAIASGNPGQSEASLGDGLRSVFATAVGGPWCFLEFGNVDWCREPARLDPRLRAAAARLAQVESASHSPGSGDSAALLAAARTNGDLFLAFPANGPQRNSINDTGSLLRVMCQSTDANNCTGPTASEAQFRTSGATWSRAGGLLLIVIGSVGMVCVLSFIALRLLGAAVTSLFYLLMAPVAVLAPALGDGGRAAFRAWGRRLLGALVAKLIYSVLLGVVLLMLRVLEGLGALGWWTQWLLVACLWWTAFAHRHQVLGLVSGHEGEGRGRGRPLSALLYGRELTRLGARVRDVGRSDRRPPPGRRLPRLEDPTRAESQRKRSDLAPDPSDTAPRLGPATSSSGSDPRAGSGAGTASSSTTAGAKSTRPPMPDRELLADQLQRTMLHAQPERGETIARQTRLAHEIAQAHAAGDTRRARRLEARAQRVKEESDSGHEPADTARGHAGAAPESARAERSDWLDRQAFRPAGRERASTSAERRDYAHLASLVGLTPARYRSAAGAEQLRARLAIDRELDRRRQVLNDQHAVPAPTADGTAPRPQTPDADRQKRPPGRGPFPARADSANAAPAPESTVMRRERQLLRERGVSRDGPGPPRGPRPGPPSAPHPAAPPNVGG